MEDDKSGGAGSGDFEVKSYSTHSFEFKEMSKMNVGFSQITGVVDSLYALDDIGRVWLYVHEKSHWETAGGGQYGPGKVVVDSTAYWKLITDERKV